MEKVKEYRVAFGNQKFEFDYCVNNCKKFDTLKDARAYARAFNNATLFRVIRADGGSLAFYRELKL